MPAGCGFELNLPDRRSSAPPPGAQAPPDPGHPPPEVRLGTAEDRPLPPESRPQAQLADWARPIAESTGVSATALQAYGYAALAVQASAPECGLTWTTLAGVGAVESRHGTLGGTELDGTGRPQEPIIGVPLDGSAEVRRVDDTDGAAYDGDPVFDRAVGPLQFIPETWERWAVDADLDGRADPHDIDDAALAAARYLCSQGEDMSDPEGFWETVLVYNQSNSYVQDVVDYADHYGGLSRPPQPGERD
nr:lytic murein transglycosylase [Saccharopolyspora sp. HNM0983]